MASKYFDVYLDHEKNIFVHVQANDYRYDNIGNLVLMDNDEVTQAVFAKGTYQYFVVGHD